ncbi:hypothetical protein PT974_01640 [Cladobotryum mycophilum]|uniref:Uncharacterized protein n=1 Tax=Cladobotryum mycophilum TaxID=491253 RepID=A0ABR0T435_9HYPO
MNGTMNSTLSGAMDRTLNDTLNSMINGTVNQLIKENPDIAGPGVMLSILGSAALTICITTLRLVIYDSNGNVELTPGNDPEKRPGSNPIDLLFLNLREKFVGLVTSCFPQKRQQTPDAPSQTNNSAKKARHNELDKFILKLCIGHLVVGFAYLVSGFIALGTSPMTVYHWKVLTGLAWFSEITLLLGLLFLHRYFTVEVRKRNLALAFTIIYTILLVVAMIPTMYPMEDSLQLLSFWKEFLSTGHFQVKPDYQFQEWDTFVSRLLVMIHLGLVCIQRCLELWQWDSSSIVDAVNRWFNKATNSALSRLCSDGNKPYHSWWNHIVIQPLSANLHVIRLCMEVSLSKTVQACGIGASIIGGASTCINHHLWISHVTRNLGVPGVRRSPLHTRPEQDTTTNEPEPLDAPQQNRQRFFDYETYVASSWRPWLLAFILLNAAFATTNILYALSISLPIAWSLSGLVPWYCVGLPVSLVLFVQISSGFECILKHIRLKRTSRTIIMQTINAFQFLGFTALGFLSCASNAFFLSSKLGEWCQSHGFNGFHNFHGSLGLLWWILIGLAVAYQLACFIACMKPWKWINRRTFVRSEAELPMFEMVEWGMQAQWLNNASSVGQRIEDQWAMYGSSTEQRRRIQWLSGSLEPINEDI